MSRLKWNFGYLTTFPAALGRNIVFIKSFCLIYRECFFHVASGSEQHHQGLLGFSGSLDFCSGGQFWKDMASVLDHLLSSLLLSWCCHHQHHGPHCYCCHFILCVGIITITAVTELAFTGAQALLSVLSTYFPFVIITGP